MTQGLDWLGLGMDGRLGSDVAPPEKRECIPRVYHTCRVCASIWQLQCFAFFYPAAALSLIEARLVSSAKKKVFFFVIQKEQ